MNAKAQILKPEITPQPVAAKLDYWWHKDNIRQLTAELPLSRINAAKKILSKGQIYQFKMVGSRTIKANISNLKKNADFITELEILAWGDNLPIKLSEFWEESHSEIIALVNGELTHELYEECCNNQLPLFLLPTNINWKCTCSAVTEDPKYICEHILAIIFKILEECKYMPILFFQFRGFGLSEFKQLFFDLPVDDSGRAELPKYLEPDFYKDNPIPLKFGDNWIDDYYGHKQDFSEISGKELEPFREQQYYFHKFNRDFYESLNAIKLEMAKFWQSE